MATLTELAPRVLQKLGILAANEAASPADREKALEKLRAAHSSFGVQNIAQWTLNDIPAYAEEPYVMMAAFLASPEFDKKPDPSLVVWAVQELQRAVNLPSVDVVQTEYF